MKVRCIDTGAEHFIGFFDHIRRRPGDVFDLPTQPRRALKASETKQIEHDERAKASYEAIKDKDGKIPQGFSFVWMEPAPGERESTSTSQQALDRKSADIKAEKAGAKTADVI